MNDRTLIAAGGGGAALAAICCFTPALVILLGAVGLSSVVGYLDYVLFPALAVSLGLLGYGLYRRSQRRAACCATDTPASTKRPS